MTRDDRRLERTLAAVHAAADPAPLARALARLAERDARAQLEPAWVRWLSRPAALAAAGALLVMSVSASLWIVRDTSDAAAPSLSADPIAGLLGEDGSLGLGVPGSDASGAALRPDSGEVR